MWDFNSVCDEIKRRDEVKVEGYNKRKRERNQPHLFLHTELGPCPFEGDINSSPLVLLLANPSSQDVVIGDHQAPTKDWPLGGLGPEASPQLQLWWSRRLGKLIEHFDNKPKHISRSVAALQLNPWASQKFDAELNLPSRELMLEIVRSVVERGALVIIMRARKQWSQCQQLSDYQSKIFTKSIRCSYISEGNLGSDAWTQVLNSIETHLLQL